MRTKCCCNRPFISSVWPIAKCQLICRAHFQIFLRPCSDLSYNFLKQAKQYPADLFQHHTATISCYQQIFLEHQTFRDSFQGRLSSWAWFHENILSPGSFGGVPQPSTQKLEAPSVLYCPPPWACDHRPPYSVS